VTASLVERSDDICGEPGTACWITFAPGAKGSVVTLVGEFSLVPSLRILLTLLENFWLIAFTRYQVGQSQNAGNKVEHVLLTAAVGQANIRLFVPLKKYKQKYLKVN